MSVRIRTFAAVVVAATALATAWALAAAVQPATHLFIKGEQFRYSNVFTIVPGTGEGVIVIDGPKTLSAVEEIDVVGVSASEVTLASHVELDQATDLTNVSDIVIAPGANTIRASRDGAWRYPDGRVAENFVTWDPVQLGVQPSALTAGQHWNVDAPRTTASGPSHAVVRVVSVDPDNLTLHVEGAPEPIGSGTSHTSRWYADVSFEFGVVREIHRVAVLRMDRGPGMPGVEDRIERRIRLLSHMAP